MHLQARGFDIEVTGVRCGLFVCCCLVVAGGFHVREAL